MQKQFGRDAVGHLEDALEEWKAYTELMAPRYGPQLMQRTHYMDWEKILAEVEKELEQAKLEADCPDVYFTNLEDGMRLTAGSDLSVEIRAEDQHGIQEVKLYLNGLLLNPTDERTWNASGDELLQALKPGIYHLEAIARDLSGFTGKQEIRIMVGEADKSQGTDWVNMIHRVILNEGEVFLDSDVLEFPRLECYLALRDDGRMVLYHGSPGKSNGMIWKAMMHSDKGDQHYSTLDRGRLITYRGTPERQEATPYMTREVSGPGPFRLGITTGKRLVIYREPDGGGMDIVWKNEILEKWRL
jgi:hypothetical protein